MLRPYLAPLLIAGNLGLVAACASAAPPNAQPGTRAAPAHAPAVAPAIAAKTEAAPAESSDRRMGALLGQGEVRPQTPAPNAAMGAGETTEAGTEEAPPIPAEPRTVVLHVGDSFLMAGFSQALRPKMKAVGALYEIRSEQASYTTTWHQKLAKLVGDYHPDLVIINLGANEITLTDPPARSDAIARLIKIVGDRPCVWVTPPLWRKDTGIIDVIRKNVGHCRLFDSDALAGPISRQADGIHPDGPGGAAWAEAFWKWLQKERAPAPKQGEKPIGGSGRHAVNPWRLKLAQAQPALQKTASTAP